MLVKRFFKPLQDIKYLYRVAVQCWANLINPYNIRRGAVQCWANVIKPYNIFMGSCAMLCKHYFSLFKPHNIFIGSCVMLGKPY